MSPGISKIVKRQQKEKPILKTILTVNERIACNSQIAFAARKKKERT